MAWEYLGKTNYSCRKMFSEDLKEIAEHAVSLGFTQINFTYSGGTPMYGNMRQIFGFLESEYGVQFIESRTGLKWSELL